MVSQETTINMVDTTFETLKKEVDEAKKVLKLQQGKVEKLAELLSKHQNELEAINNEVITMLIKNRQELEPLRKVDDNRLLINNDEVYYDEVLAKELMLISKVE